MSAQIIFRDATPNDAADMAILDNIAGHGISLWFWQEAVMQAKARDALEWGRARMLDPDNPFGWRNARIAEREGEVAGCAASYVMPRIDFQDAKLQTPQMRGVFELFALVEGDFLLDSLAVYERHSRRGVGKALLADFHDRARTAECAGMAIVTDDANTPARTLYEKAGFRVTDSRPLIPHNDSVTSENWVLYRRSVQ